MEKENKADHVSDLTAARETQQRRCGRESTPKGGRIEEKQLGCGERRRKGGYTEADKFVKDGIKQ